MSIRKPSDVLKFDVAAEINVTPMIDVMLVLLIIFMVVTPTISGAMLPTALHADYEPGKHPTLIIGAQGQMSLEVDHRTRPVDARSLQALLARTYAARQNDHVLYLKADRNLEYTRVLSAIESARAAGVTRLAAITESPRRARRR
ncbi:MAG TPA: biopolymer transporter ExbD [Longimicrobium sp.]|nr:biopolymer transporter ExbD [Longimicrobium sp.]